MRRPLTDDVTDPRTPVVVAARRTPVATAGRGLAALDLTQARGAGARGGGGRRQRARGRAGGRRGAAGRVHRAGWRPGAGGAAAGGARRRGSRHDGRPAVRQRARGGVAGGGTGGDRCRAWCWPAGPRARARRAPAGPGSRPRSLGDPDMGVAAEDLAARRGVRRERQDAYAARSHALAVAAQDAGVYDAEPGARRRRGARRPTPPPADTRCPAGVPRRVRGRRHGDGGQLVRRERRRGGGRGGRRGDPGAARAARARGALGGVGRRPPAAARPGPGARRPRRARGRRRDVGRPRRHRDHGGVRRAGARLHRRAWAWPTTTRGCAPRAGRSRWGTPGARAVRCSSSGCSPSLVRAPGGRLGLATCAVGGGQGVAAVFERVGP
nr:hypothetical protein [Angustibacter aerolatus]